MTILSAMGGVGAFLVLAVLGVILGTLPGVFPARKKAAVSVFYVLTAAVSALLCTMAVAFVLAAPAPEAAWLPLGLPWLGAHFRLDGLSAVFLAVVNFGGAAAGLYAVGYGRHEEHPRRVLPFYPAFLAGMNATVLAADAFSFLLAWEFMSLTSWALVMASHREAENARAGYVYLLMAGFGTLVLLLAFGLLAGPAGAYAFADMRGMVRPDWVPGAVLVLALAGAGSKAGLVPLHAWLPLAHPAAPSHVSALMSGVMTKVAVYGFIRIVFDLLGPPAWWWGLTVMVPAAATAVLGVLHATAERDVKRLLAYSTVENVGIIFIGLGLALAFRANGMTGPAALAFIAALFHVLNHALFKSLLFFGAGATLTATGERDIEKLGGLIHRMPQTAFAVLGGSLAISALPPLNGFVSEWLIFQAVLLSPNLPQWGLKLIVPAAGAMLALSAALSAACFVRAFGITFLGRARSAGAQEAGEADVFSRAAMFLLLLLCFLAGVLPGFVIDALAPAARLAVGQNMPPQASLAWLSIVPVAESRSSYDGLLIFVFILSSALLAAQIIHRFASHEVRRGPAWDCGYPETDPATQYSAASFAQPLIRVFGEYVFLTRERVTMPPPGGLAPARLEVTSRDLAWEFLYLPVRRAVTLAADKSNYLQFLTIRRYLLLVFAALVALLLAVAIWP